MSKFNFTLFSSHKITLHENYHIKSPHTLYNNNNNKKKRTWRKAKFIASTMRILEFVFRTASLSFSGNPERRLKIYLLELLVIFFVSLSVRREKNLQYFLGRSKESWGVQQTTSARAF